jgi:capsular exopolysaccharide synthesis family protein
LSWDDPFAPMESGQARQAGGTAHQDNLLETAREYLLGLRRRWRLVVLVVLLALAAAVAHFVVTPPIYEADCIIQIERRSTNSLLSSQLPWLDHYFNLEFYPTQYRLLESRGLAEEVVRDLRLMEDPKYARGGAGAEAGSAGEDRAMLGSIANRLRSRLSVEPVRETQLVRVTFRSDQAGEAARIANAFAESFIEFGIRTRSETMSEATDVLGEQVTTLKAEVADIEERLSAFSGDQTTFTFTPEGEVAFERLGKLNDDLMDAKRRRIEKQARWQELVSTPAEMVAADSPTMQELRREQLSLEREYQTQSQTYKSDWPGMVELAERIERGESYLRQQLEAEAAKVRRGANAEYQAALREEQALAAEIRGQRAQMSSENAQAVEFNNLQMELTARRELLDDLVKRQSETAFATRLQTDKSSNVRIVDEALVPSSPTHPSLRQDLGAGLAAGLLLGVGLGLLLQFLDRSIKSADELERILGIPVLAVVPDVSDEGRGTGYGYQYAYSYGGDAERSSRAASPKRWLEKKPAAEKMAIELLPHTRPRLAVSETYRALRTALLLSSAEELKVLAVTSVESSEGKTATATNLAVVLAQLGRRVVLIDGDLRKPRLHKVFGVSNRTGLVSYLTTGSEDGIYHRTEVGGLFVLPSGPIPPNPSELLSSERMRELVARLRGAFDYVVVDTPPTLAVTDATVAGTLADGVVLCVRSGRVDRRDAVRALDRLTLSDIKVLGAVLNAHSASGGGGDYRYYRAYVESEQESQTEAGSAA